ncbi:MAG: Crp/Fnr family transcriptional regulator [Ignavibacteria bacterium]
MFNKQKSENDILISKLQGCPLFQDLSNSELKALLGTAHIRDYSADEKIFDDGTIGLCFYLIIKGSVKIISDNGDKAEVVREFSEGGYFSEVHLFSETPHTVSCVSGEISRLLILAKPDFDELVKMNSKLGNKVLLRFLKFFGNKLEELYRENRDLRGRQ